MKPRVFLTMPDGTEIEFQSIEIEIEFVIQSPPKFMDGFDRAIDTIGRGHGVVCDMWIEEYRNGKRFLVKQDIPKTF